MGVGRDAERDRLHGLCNQSEIGLSGHLGWIATSGDSTLHSRAIAADFHIAIGSHLSLTGAAFVGQALAGVGGGGIGQDLGTGGAPLRTRGGWVQLDVRPTFAWEFGAGAGMDDPDDRDLEGGPPLPGGLQHHVGRLRNVVVGGHLIWRPGGGLLLGAEARRIETTFATATPAMTHVNVYAGVAF